MQRYSDFLEHRTQYNESYNLVAAPLSSTKDAEYAFQRGEPASAAPATEDPPRRALELAKISAPSAAAATSTPDAGARSAQAKYQPSEYDPGPTQPAGYVPAHRPPSRGWGGIYSNLRAGLRGAASSAYTVPQAFKSAAFGSDEETRMAAQNPKWKGAYGGATGSRIRAYRVGDEDLAQAEMRELESLKASTRDRVFQTVLAYTIKELQKESQARLKALTDKDMAARKANPFDIKKPKNDAPDDGYYDHNQWYYNDDVIILDEGWGRDFYRHAASAGAGIGGFLKGVIPRTFGGFTGWDTEKVRGPYKDSKAYGGFMGAVQQSRNAAQKSLDMADIRAAESIVSRSSHPLVIRQLVSFIRAKKGLKGSEKSIATANAYLRKITKGQKTSWRTLEEMPEGPYDGGSINDIIRKQTGVAPAGPAVPAGPAAAGGSSVPRSTNSLANMEDFNKAVNSDVVGREMKKVSDGDLSGFPIKAHPEIKEEWERIKDLPNNDPKKHERFAYLMRYHNHSSRNESRNYSRSLESIYNESFLDSMGKGIKAGYDSADHYLGKVPGLARLGRGAKNAYNYMTRSPKQKDFTIAPDQEDFTVAPDQDKPEIMDQDQYAKSAEMRLAYLRKKAGVKDMGSQVNAAGSGPSASYKPNNHGYDPAMEWSDDTRYESRNYSRSLESIYNESFLDSIGKGIKAGYDYMTGSQKKQDKVPQEMTENQRTIYYAMLQINKMSADQYESMSEKNKAKAFRYAMDQVLDINDIPHINLLINMNDEDKIKAWTKAKRRLNPILSSLGY